MANFILKYSNDSIKLPPTLPLCNSGLVFLIRALNNYFTSVPVLNDNNHCRYFGVGHADGAGVPAGVKQPFRSNAPAANNGFLIYGPVIPPAEKTQEPGIFPLAFLCGLLTLKPLFLNPMNLAMKQLLLLSLIFCLLLPACSLHKKTVRETLSATTGIAAAAVDQYSLMAAALPRDRFPKSWDSAAGKLVTSGPDWRCSGFYPGSLFCLYEPE